MADELKHLTVGTALTQSEYEAVGGHVFACQAKGDILYASSTSQLSRIGKGAQNTLFSMGACCTPAWVASPSVTDLTIGGGCISLTVATDIDLIDNNASALSFDATGKTGIIDIVTTNSSEGVTMSGTLGVTGAVTFSADLLIKDQGDLRLEESGSGCSYVAIQAPACLAANYTLTLPADDGCACEFLQTNGSGVLDWAAAGVGCGPLQISGGSNSAPAYSFCGDTNTGMYRICADVIGFTTGGTQRVRLSGGNLQVCTSELMLNEDTNSNMAQGITIQQSANDNEILTLKSSDIAHGMTDRTETDTYGRFGKAVATTGGVLFEGYSEDVYGIYMLGYGVNDNTTKSTSGQAYVWIDARKKSSAGAAGVGSDANLVVISDNQTTRFIFDAEGSGHADVEWTTYDKHCDIELLRGMHGELTPCYKTTFGQDMMYNLCTYERLGLVGRDSVHWEDRADGRHQLRGMINFTGLTMLHHSTIIQMNDKLTARLDSIESRLALPEGK